MSEDKLDPVTFNTARFGVGGVHQGKSFLGTAATAVTLTRRGLRNLPTWLELRGENMAAMKPRTGDGPLEVTKEGRGIVMRVPLEGGGRLVVEMTPDEANALGDALKTAAG
jgi:uncharacterized protein DUF3117